jgi:hypothetical protein
MTVSAMLATSGLASAAIAAPARVATASSAGEVVHGPATVIDQSDEGEMHAAYTRGFTITNMSSHPLKLESTNGMGWEDGAPVNGSVIAPGHSTGFEVSWVWGSTHSVVANYAILDSDGRKIGTYMATMSVTSDIAWTLQSSYTQISMGQSLDGGQQLTVLDAPGSVVDIPAGQGQAQAQVLNTLCYENPQAKCSFTPTKRVKALGPKHVVDGIVYNNTPDDQTGSRTFEDTVSTSHNIEVSASVEATIMEIVTVTITATYGHSWEDSHTFSTNEDLTVRPYWKAWLEARQPVIRDTGDFTITLGNTTWHLRGVSFDTPDTGGVGAYIKQAAPMTPDEIQEHAPVLALDATVNAADL